MKNWDNTITSKRFFKRFISEMNSSLGNYGRDLESQARMLNLLYKYECTFREKMASCPEGIKMYANFVKYIVETEENLLACRVFLRERQNVFTKKVAPAFRNNNVSAIMKFKINYKFCKWVMDNAPPKLKRKLSTLYSKILDVRKDFCEQNLPAAVHRAKVIWSAVDHSQLSYLDMIQLAAEGLMLAIDKYELPYADNFGNVAYSRMTLSITDAHNDTMLKFTSNDKRILQRAKRGMQGNVESLENFVKESFEKTDINEINEIVQAEVMIGLESPIGEDGQVSDFIADLGNPEITVLARDLKIKLYGNLKQLGIFENKIVAMKFGDLAISLKR